jgi:hypothetical protein
MRERHVFITLLSALFGAIVPKLRNKTGNVGELLPIVSYTAYAISGLQRQMK